MPSRPGLILLVIRAGNEKKVFIIEQWVFRGERRLGAGSWMLDA